MFKIDTGAGSTGSKGPWLQFKPKGSSKYGFPWKSWVLREKKGEETVYSLFQGMTNGIVLDIYTDGSQLLGSLKLGFSLFENDKSDRRYWASALRPEPRPDESKNAQGGYNWRNALSVRCAIGGGLAATWEDEGWGIYKAFDDLVKIMNSQFADNIGKCPLVRVTGYVDDASKTSSPVFEVVKWVPRPDCLKEEAPQIATAPAQQAQAPAPVAPVAGAAPASVPADVAF